MSRRVLIVDDHQRFRMTARRALEADGWTVEVAWRGAHGVDIAARRDTDLWLIEVKGRGSRPEMRVNYFLAILGETLQRMSEPQARYSIGLPDISGLAVARSVREHDPGIAVVVISTHDSADYRELALASGARGFLAKSGLSGAALEAILGS